MKLFRRRQQRPMVTFVDDFDGTPLPLWAVRAGMLVVRTDYELGGRALRVRVRRQDSSRRWDEQKPHWASGDGA